MIIRIIDNKGVETVIETSSDINIQIRDGENFLHLTNHPSGNRLPGLPGLTFLIHADARLRVLPVSSNSVVVGIE